MTRYLQLNEGRIAYDDTEAEGPLVILVPGIGDLRSQYRFVREPLAKAGFRVVTMDLRGAGASDATFSRYDGESIAHDVLALIRHLNAGPAVIVGNSIAGGSAVTAAAEAPALVDRIVLVGGFARGPNLSLPMRILVSVLVGGPWRVAAWMGLHGTLFPLAKTDDHDAHRAAMREALAQPGHSAALGQMMQSRHDHAEARLANVRAPALFVMGSQDSDFPDPSKEAEEVAAAMGGQVAMIEGAGHYPHVEAPSAWLEVVLPFLIHRAPDERVSKS